MRGPEPVVEVRMEAVGTPMPSHVAAPVAPVPAAVWMAGEPLIPIPPKIASIPGKIASISRKVAPERPSQRRIEVAIGAAEVGSGSRLPSWPQVAAVSRPQIGSRACLVTTCPVKTCPVASCQVTSCRVTTAQEALDLARPREVPSSDVARRSPGEVAAAKLAKVRTVHLGPRPGVSPRRSVDPRGRPGRFRPARNRWILECPNVGAWARKIWSRKFAAAG